MTIRSYIDRYQVNKGDGAYLGQIIFYIKCRNSVLQRYFPVTTSISKIRSVSHFVFIKVKQTAD